ncbi:sporulation integral membrane protein YtvI [Provencibacterium massiliense]|uniref:sporulation integral membrane protein YtvI n=1 Tax=Provencibacterium massiliense TaxID=1841868 RepID=UPI0009A85146|nr:sporulation integral membrane protein YtvI [Provencibacterium massiliense]RGB69922.1 sporulation integral membrane protein YtvI [Harryflintia acetispora]
MPEFEKRVAFIVNVLFVGLIVAVVLVVLRFVVPCTLPFVIGFLIAFLLKPITTFITRNTTFRRKPVALLVITLFYLAITTIALTLFAVLFSQLGRLLGSLPELYSEGLEPALDQLNALVYDLLGWLTPSAATHLESLSGMLMDTLKNTVADLSAAAVGWVTSAIKGLPMFLTTLIFTVISSILISADYNKVSSFLLRQLPMRYRHMVLDAKDFLFGSLLRMLKAYVIIMAITMVELAIGLWALGVELYIAIAGIIALLDILPLIGTGGILIPWAIIELSRGNYFLGAGLLVLLAVVTLVRQFIEPKIVGNQIGLHPIVTIAAMYCGLRLFGFLGLILAPLTVILIKYLNDSGKVQFYH